MNDEHRMRQAFIKDAAWDNYVRARLQPLLSLTALEDDTQGDEQNGLPNFRLIHAAAANEYQAAGISIHNVIVHPVVLGKLSHGNTVGGFGPVRDLEPVRKGV